MQRARKFFILKMLQLKKKQHLMAIFLIKHELKKILLTLPHLRSVDSPAPAHMRLTRVRIGYVARSLDSRD